VSEPTILFRKATSKDLEALLVIESHCFAIDRLSRRSFRHHIKSPNSDLLVLHNAHSDTKILAYGLVLNHQGTRLARLYSIALHPDLRGKGIAKKLLAALEMSAVKRNRLYMRLEVAINNDAAIQLYQSMAYRVFGEYSDYYEDHSDALRMQKRIRDVHWPSIKNATPWFQQTTEFTCGPAALIMAMASLKKDQVFTQSLEIEIWREATTIFMTAGHGGCHPYGLALAARKRGFHAEAWVNLTTPLFIDGVRCEQKKQVMTLVHSQFVTQCKQAGVAIHHKDIGQYQVWDWLQQGCSVIILISTYRLDGKKTPHWVVAAGMDEQCIYVHDPDPSVDENSQLPLDCQYVPIARDDFDKMSAFGSNRLRAAVVLSQPSF
jgi:ribosomal protein S18 acetylase RimI-like enzyme